MAVAEKLFRELERLNHADRVGKVVLLGKRTTEDRDQEGVIDNLENDFAFSGRTLALHSCYGSRDGERAFRLYKESTSPALRKQALKCLLVVGNDSQILEVLATVPPQTLKTSFRKLHKRKRSAVIDSFLKSCANKGETDLLKELVFYASSDSIQALWENVEKKCTDKAWSFLANFHPAFTVTRLLASDSDTLHKRLSPALPWLCLHLPEDAWTCFKAVPREDLCRVSHLDHLIRLFPDRVLDVLLNIPDAKHTASLPPISTAPTLYKELVRQHYFAWDLPTKPVLLRHLKRLSTEQRLKVMLDGIAPLSSILPKLNAEGRAALFQCWLQWWESQQDSLNTLTAYGSSAALMRPETDAISITLSTLAFRPWLETNTPWLAPKLQYQLLELVLKHTPKFFFDLHEGRRLSHLTAVVEEDRLSLLLQHPQLRTSIAAASLSPANQVILYQKTVQEAVKTLQASYNAIRLPGDAASTQLDRIVSDRAYSPMDAVESTLGVEQTPALSPFEARMSGLSHHLPTHQRASLYPARRAALSHLTEEQRRDLLLALESNPMFFIPDWSTTTLSAADEVLLQSAAKRMRSFLASDASSTTDASTDTPPPLTVTPPRLNQQLQGEIISQWTQWWAATKERVLLPLRTSLEHLHDVARACFLIPLAGGLMELGQVQWAARLEMLSTSKDGPTSIAQDDLEKLLGTWLQDDEKLLQSLLEAGWPLFKNLDAERWRQLAISYPTVFVRVPKLCGLLPEDQQLVVVQQWNKQYQRSVAAVGVIMEGALPELRAQLEERARKLMNGDGMMAYGLEYLADAVKKEMYLSGLGQFAWFAPWQNDSDKAKFLKHLPEPERTDCARALMLHDPEPPTERKHTPKRPISLWPHKHTPSINAAMRAEMLWERTQQFGAFLPWNELMEQEALKEKMQSSDPNERIQAIKFLVKVAELKPSHFKSLLKLLHQKRREQDPVRMEWLGGVNRLTADWHDDDGVDKAEWNGSHGLAEDELGGLETLIDDALAAKDLSYGSVSAMMKLLFTLTPLYPRWGVSVLPRLLTNPSVPQTFATDVMGRMKTRLKKFRKGAGGQAEQQMGDLLEVAMTVVKAAGQLIRTGTAIAVFQQAWRWTKAVSGGLNKRSLQDLLRGEDAWMWDLPCQGWDVQKPKLLALLQELMMLLESKPPLSGSVQDAWLCRVVLKNLPDAFPATWHALDRVMSESHRAEVLRYLQKEKKLEHLKLFLRQDKNHTLGKYAAKDALALIIAEHGKKPEVTALVSSLLSQDPTYILIPKVFTYVSHHHQEDLTPLLSQHLFHDGLYLDLQISNYTFWLNITPMYVHCWNGAQQAQLASTLVSVLQRGGLSLTDAKGIMNWLIAMPACPVNAFLSLLQTDQDSLPDAIRELVLGSLVADNSHQARAALIAACNTDQCSTAVAAITSMLTAQRGWQDEAGFNAMMDTLRSLPWARVAVLKEVIRFLSRVAKEQPQALNELLALAQKSDLHRSGQIVLCEELKRFLDRKEVLEFFIRVAASEDFQVASAAAVMPEQVAEDVALAENVAKLYVVLLESPSQRLRQTVMQNWHNRSAQVPWKQGLHVVEKILTIANAKETDRGEADEAQSSAQQWLLNAARVKKNFSSE